MTTSRVGEELDEAVRYARAGLDALERARKSVVEDGHLYSTYVYVAAADLAHAIETSMQAALLEE